jgi:predicted DNA-binding transcriptional regulator AlpA
MNTPNDEWMTAQQIADEMSVSTQTVRRWSVAADGFPTPYRFARRSFRWKRAEIEAFIAAAKNPNNPTFFVDPRSI